MSLNSIDDVRAYTTEGSPTAPSSARSLFKAPPFVAFLLLTACVPLARPPVAVVRGQPVQLSDLLVIAFYVALFWKWVRGEVRPKVDRLLVVTLIYVAVLASSLAVRGALLGSGGIKLVAYGAFLLLPWASALVVNDAERLKQCVFAWGAGVLLATSIGLLGIIAFYLDRNGLGNSMMCGYGSLHSAGYPRLCAPFSNQNMFMDYLTAGLPLAILAFDAWFRPAIKWTLLSAVGLVGLLTLSGSAGGFAIAAAILLIAKRRNAGRTGAINWLLGLAAALAAVFFLVAMIVTVVPAGEGDVSLGNTDIKLMDGPRPSIWRGVLPGLEAHPVLGLGYGSSVSEVTDPRAYMPADKLKTIQGPLPPKRLEAHNVWLSVLGQAGIVGFGAFLLLLSELTKGWLWRARGTVPIPFLKEALVASFCGALLYNGNFDAFEEARHIWPLLALAAAAASVAARRPSHWKATSSTAEAT